MKWRRKTLVVGLLLGAGVCFFNPLLSYSISQRIRTDWGMEARVSTARLALGTGSLILEDLRIEDDSNALDLKQLHMKLHTDRLWYRDFIVEAMVGKGLHWKLADPFRSSIAGVDSIGLKEIENPQAWMDSKCQELEAGLNRLVSKASESITDSERYTSARTQAVDTRMDGVRRELDRLTDPNDPSNPLRSEQRLRWLQSEEQQIRMMLAEDRTDLKNRDRTFANTIAEVQAFAMKTPEVWNVSSEQLDTLVQAVERELLADVQSQVGPYLSAGKFAFERLVLQKPETHGSPEKNPSPSTDLAIPAIPRRVTQIQKAKLTGRFEFAGRSEEMEIRLQTSSSAAAAMSGKITLVWGANSASGLPMSSQSMAPDSTECVVSSLGGMANDPIYRMDLVRHGDQRELSSQSQIYSDRVEHSVHVSSQVLNALPVFEKLGIVDAIDLQRSEPLTIHSTPRTMDSRSEAEAIEGSLKTESNIPSTRWFANQSLQLSTQDRVWLRQRFEHALRTQLEGRYSQLQTQLRSSADVEIHRLQLRTDAIAAGMKVRQEAWQNQASQWLREAEEWEKQKLRASSPSSSMVR